jgi:hypothetical protein
MAELFVNPSSEVIVKNYDFANFIPTSAKDEGYTILRNEDPKLPDLCNGVLMICNAYAFDMVKPNPKYAFINHDTKPDRSSINFDDKSIHAIKRTVALKIMIPDIADTQNIIHIRRTLKDYLELSLQIHSTVEGIDNPIDFIIRKYGFFLAKKGFNPYISDRVYAYARATMARCINFLLYSICYNIGVGINNGTQHCLNTVYPSTTYYRIHNKGASSSPTIVFNLEIDNVHRSGSFTITSSTIKSTDYTRIKSMDDLKSEK